MQIRNLLIPFFSTEVQSTVNHVNNMNLERKKKENELRAHAFILKLHVSEKRINGIS